MEAAVKALLARGLAAPEAHLLLDRTPSATAPPTPVARPPPGMPRTVLVTGISGNLGRTLAKLLHTETQVVGVDRRPFVGQPQGHRPPPGGPAQGAGGGGLPAGQPIEAVIHMGIMHDPRMPFTEAHSFNLVGHPQDPRPLRPPRGAEGGGALLGQRLRPATGQLQLPGGGDAADGGRPLQRRARPDRARHVRAVVHVEAPGDRDGHPAPRQHHRPDRAQRAANYLRLEVPVTLMGFDPMLQLIHEEDACRAMVLALRPGCAASST